MARSPVFVALDTVDADAAEQLAGRLGAAVGGVKLGLEFFCANGPGGVERIARGGLPLFLDLKFHDIPNTVAKAVRAVTPLAPDLLTVHASGGGDMLRAAADAAADAAARTGVDRPKLVAVTVLTSLSDEDLGAVGQQPDATEQARRLAELAQRSGMDGIVCSPHEAARLRADRGPDFLLVVPGVRPAWAEAQDQKRVMTPARAMAAGASLLVIGRPITGQPDPKAAAERIADELAGAGSAIRTG